MEKNRRLAPLCAGGSSPSAAKDSPQAPPDPRQGLLLLPRTAQEGTITERRFDVLVGKHSDHIGGERMRAACLKSGAAAACAPCSI